MARSTAAWSVTSSWSVWTSAAPASVGALGLKSILAACGHQQARALGGEGARRGQADAGTGAGDEGDLVRESIFCLRVWTSVGSILFCAQWGVRLGDAVLSYGPVLVGESGFLRAMEHVGEIIGEPHMDAGLGGSLARETSVLDGEHDGGAGVLRRVEDDLAVVLVELGLKERAVDRLMKECARDTLRFGVDERLPTSVWFMEVIIRLPPSLSAWACQGSRETMVRPRLTDSSNGRTCASGSSAPEATIQSLPASAMAGRPKTGAPT